MHVRTEFSQILDLIHLTGSIQIQIQDQHGKIPLLYIYGSIPSVVDTELTENPYLESPAQNIRFEISGMIRNQYPLPWYILPHFLYLRSFLRTGKHHCPHTSHCLHFPVQEVFHHNQAPFFFLAIRKGISISPLPIPPLIWRHSWRSSRA